MIALLYAYAFWALLPAIVIAALLYGGPPERAVAKMYAAAAILSVVARTTHYSQIEVGLFLIDTSLMIGVGYVALYADRWWPLLSTSFLALGVLAHIAKAAEPRLWKLGYQIMEQASSYPVILILAAGTWRHHRRAQRNANASSAIYSNVAAR